ncbi:MAG: glycoside-pentoside-hexuronide (GPH):cation symporter [Treponemataceae bacterium]
MDNQNKLDKKTFWCYTAGATGRDAAYALISLYLLAYIQYTMNLTVAQFAAVSAIIVLCRIWDAINDPMMGIIIENSKMKMGKFKPWILMGSILNACFIVALFAVRPSGWGFVAFFAFAYLFWGMTYTMNDISYWGMMPSLSSDAKERTKLVTVMSVFICLGQFTVAGVIPLLVAGDAVKSYMWVAVAVAVLFIGCQLLTSLGCKERCRPDTNNIEDLKLSSIFKIFARNDQLIVSGIAILLFQVGSNLLIVFAMNFSYLEFGYTKGGSVAFILTLMYAFGTLFSQLLFPVFVKFIKKKQIIFISTIIISIFYLFLLLVGFVLPKSIILFSVFLFVIFFFQGFFNMTLIVLLNNTIEYDEYKFKERHDSVISAVRSFATKLAAALQVGIANLVLIISGLYAVTRKIAELESEKGKGLKTAEQVLQQADSFVQTVSVDKLFVLRLGMCILPILFLGAAMILIQKKYKIDEVEYERMVKEINERQN